MCLQEHRGKLNGTCKDALFEKVRGSGGSMLCSAPAHALCWRTQPPPLPCWQSREVSPLHVPNSNVTGTKEITDLLLHPEGQFHQELPCLLSTAYQVVPYQRSFEFVCISCTCITRSAFPFSPSPSPCRALPPPPSRRSASLPALTSSCRSGRRVQRTWRSCAKAGGLGIWGGY